MDVRGVRLYPVPGWDFDWLVHGTTGDAEPGDLGLFGPSPAGTVHARWRALLEALGTPRAVHSHQVHGDRVLHHGGGDAGLLVTEGYDGHATAAKGVLLTVSVADCVPIFLVDVRKRSVALLHGGWRGTVAGVVEAGLDALGAAGVDVFAHLGPAICGECYEVGPEVHHALGLEVPTTNTPVDLRAVQARRLRTAGVPAEQITISGHCTLCGGGFYSHRGGGRERQLGVLALR